MSRVLGFSIEILGTDTAVRTANELKAAIRAVNEALANTSDAADYEQLSRQLADLRVRQQNLNTEQRNYVTELRTASGGANSYIQLNARLNQLRATYRNLSEAERNSQLGRETIRNIQQLDSELRRIDASMGQFQRNVGNYPQTILGLLGQVSPALGRVTQGLTQLASTSGATSKILVGSFLAFSAVASAGTGLTKIAAETEEAKINFTALSKSMIEGTALYEDLVEFAKKTPFELPELQTATKSLLAYGFSSREVTQELRVLGDISAGVGKDKLPQIILAYGQVRAATKLTGNELRQFTEAGIPLLQALAEKGGKSVQQVKQDISDSKISFQEVQAALRDLTSEGGQFFGLMEKQSHSLNGQVSNLKDTFRQISSDLGTIFLPLIKSTTEGFGLLLGKVKDVLGLNSSLNTQLEVQGGKFQTLIGVLKDSNSSFSAKQKAIATLKAEFPELIKGTNLQTATEQQLNAVLLAGNATIRERITLNKKKTELDSTQNELSAYLEAESKKVIEVEKVRKNEIKESEKYNKIRLDNEIRQLTFIRSKIAALEAKGKFQQIEIKNLSGIAPEAAIEEKSAKEVKAEEKAADKAAKLKQKFAESELEYAKQNNNVLIALSKQLTDERIGIITNEEEIKKAQALQAFESRKESYEKEVQQQIAAIEKQRAAIIEYYGANSQKLRDFDISAVAQREQVNVFARQIELKAIEEHNVKIEKITADAAEKRKVEAEKIEREKREALEKADKETQALYKKILDDERQSFDDASRDKLTAIDEYYIELLDRTYSQESARLKVVEEYSLKAYNQKKVNLENELTLIENDIKQLELLGGGADLIANLKSDASKVNSELAKLDKQRTKEISKELDEREKLNKDSLKKQLDIAVTYTEVAQNSFNAISDYFVQLAENQINALSGQIDRQASLIEGLEKKMAGTTGKQRIELARQIEQQKKALADSVKQREAAEKEAGRKKKRIDTINATINTAVGVTKALATGNFIEAIATGIIGAIQIATINAQAFARGGLVTLSGQRIATKQNITPTRQGDNVLAYVKRGEVILNDTQQKKLGGARTFAAIGVPGFASGGIAGGFGDVLPPPSASFFESPNSESKVLELIEATNKRIDRIEVKAYVVSEDIENEQNLKQKATKLAVI